jgi:hypothetical protein
MREQKKGGEEGGRGKKPKDSPGRASQITNHFIVTRKDGWTQSRHTAASQLFNSSMDRSLVPLQNNIVG